MDKVAFADGSYDQKNNMYIYGWIEGTNGFQIKEGISATKFNPPHSAHVPEYMAIYSFIVAHADEEWTLCTDSNLVYYQLTGHWKVRSSCLFEIHQKTKEMLESNPGIKLKLIRSADNLADKVLR